MVRRVGFGGAPARAGDAVPDPEGTPVPAGARIRSRGARVVVSLILLVWLAVWSWSMWFAFSDLAAVWGGIESGASGTWDWGTLLVLGAWLVFALVGCAFGVVIFAVLLFGKPVTEERRREKEARRDARRQARQARRERS